MEIINNNNNNNNKYKRARNEVTSALRLAKASYFSKMFDEVKNTTMYWKLLKKIKNKSYSTED